MSPDRAHPAQRFVAPATIQQGAPLKELIGRPLISLIGESLAQVATGFDRKRFQTRAARRLAKLELKERALHIARAMAEQLPPDFDDAAPLLVKSLGPPLAATEGNGLAVFFYLPHSQLIATYGVAKFESGMAANYELTQRFTAEFSIRPFLIERRDSCLRMLQRWTKDPNPHVRRLVSEGTRPRLPWAMRLPEFQADPQLSMPLLEALKDDSELYVRRSVANHLGDILKDHPDFAYDVCERWLDELSKSDDATLAENRRWIVRHAVRLPAKRGIARAVRIRTMAAAVTTRKRQPRG
jgi:3-methyladenine DNA glycosylase AlkC